jgi:alkylhydroperoxidase/carboxymuconolactone decarboxylase family protein YurZ
VCDDGMDPADQTGKLDTGPTRSVAAILDDLMAVEGSIGESLQSRVYTLDSRTRSLVGIGAAASMGAPTMTYRGLVNGALGAGATVEECIGAFIAVAAVVGAARMVTGAPRIAAALGYDIDQALEGD